MSLKVFTDIIIQYIFEESVFDPSKLSMTAEEAKCNGSTKDNMCKYTTDMINNMLVNILLPRFKYLLTEEDPVPLFALKLISALTDRSDHFVSIIEKLGILPIITDYYSFGHKRLNQHTIKVIKSVIESPEIPLEALYGYEVIENTLSIIENMLEQHQVCYSETLVDVLQSIIDKVASH